MTSFLVLFYCLEGRKKVAEGAFVSFCPVSNMSNEGFLST